MKHGEAIDKLREGLLSKLFWNGWPNDSNGSEWWVIFTCKVMIVCEGLWGVGVGGQCYAIQMETYMREKEIEYTI